MIAKSRERERERERESLKHQFKYIYIGNPRHNGFTLDAIEQFEFADGDIGSFQRRQQRSDHAIDS